MSRTGIPAVRALFLDYPDCDEAWTTDDQYLLGSDLLVAPVHTKGATSREVWLPPGEWVSWWDDARLQGPGTVTVEAPLDRIPLFQRAGSAIPLLREPRADLDHALDAPTEERTV